MESTQMAMFHGCRATGLSDGQTGAHAVLSQAGFAANKVDGLLVAGAVAERG